jgi:hypothetical protein
MGALLAAPLLSAAAAVLRRICLLLTRGTDRIKVREKRVDV